MLLLVFWSSLTPPTFVIAVVVLATLAALSVWSKAPHSLRVGIILSSFAYVGVMSLGSDNPGAAILYLLAGLMLSVVLTRWQVALAYLLGAGGALGFGAWAEATQTEWLPASVEFTPEVMLATNAVTFVCVGAILVVSLTFLMNRLHQAFIDEAEKSEALEAANTRLIEEQLDKSQLERALATNQRLESVGRLAGSVAHDFNNLLMGMRGNIELSAEDSAKPETREMLTVTLELIDRAVGLTRNLLRFSRGESLGAEHLDVHRLIQDTERIYQSVIGNGVELVFTLDAERVLVAFNPTQFEQILLNLIVNAADAMPDGGRLRVTTRNITRDGVELLELTVDDEGEGMSEAVMTMIFQPYFTTKKTGSGIGLATVHEIVTQSGGDIRVESEVGRGTTFRLSFPLEVAA